MQTEMPFFDSPEDALKAAVQQLGGIKRVGPMLFPDKGVDASSRYLLDCVNSDRQEKLALSQILMLLRLAHDAGYHAPAQFLAGEMGYTVQVIEPKDEVAALQRTFIDSVATQKALIDRMERLTRAPLAQVRP